MFVCSECGASRPTPGYCEVDGTPMAPNTEDTLLGQTVGVYRIARLLGVGGMGRVYKGVHPQIGSRVAIKVLSREMSDRRDVVERFFSEARAVNLIRHESIVNVLDLATLPDGRPFIVMEFLDGAPLSAIVEQAQHSGHLLPLGGLARLAAEVLDALGAAHAKGIVHRDLKPDNIFITPAGRAKVLDFGIAKLQPELGGRATHTGSLLGTPHYMSPEQASSRPVDLRADIYAMGVILYECATLRKPFVADSLFELLRLHIEAPPPPPRTLRPDMPAELAGVILTALAKLPEQRFASAHAMSNALQHATASLPQEQWTPIVPVQGSRPPSWQATPPASWARKNAAHPTTVSAGQVTASGGRSKKGMWVGIAGGTVAIAGIAVGAIIAGKGSGSAASGSGSDVGSGSGSEVVVEKGSGSGSEAIAEIPAPVIPAPVIPSFDPDEVHEIVGSMFDNATPQAMKTWPKAMRDAKTKYHTWDKVPPKLKSQIAGAGLAEVQDLMGGMGDINSALAGGDPEPPPPPPPPKPTTDGWFERHKLSPPGFDPKHARIDQLIAFGLSEAKKNVPDAQLTWIDASGVFPDGRADFTLPSFASDHGDLTLRFISPSHAKRDPSLPRGVEGGYKKCSFYIVIAPGEAEIYDTSDKDLCTKPPVPAPKCSLSAVWKKALAKKKDLADAVAAVVYTQWGKGVGWDFTIRDGTDTLFNETFPDDCP